MPDLKGFTEILAASLRANDCLAEASIRLKIGDALMVGNSYAQAAHSYQIALKIRVEALGEDALKVANARHSVGVSLLMCSLTEKSPKVVSSLAVSGEAPEVKARDEASIERVIQCLESSLRVRRRKLGPIHIDVAETAHFLGLAKSHAGDQFLDESLELLLTAFRVRCTVLGQNNSLVAESLKSLGETYLRAGINHRAIQAFAFALSVRQSILGDDSSEIAADHLVLARTYTSSGDHEMALKHSMKAHSILKTSFGNDDIRSIESLLRVSVCHFSRGDLKSAVESSLAAIQNLSSIDLAVNLRAARLREAWTILAEARWEMQEYELGIVATHVLAYGIIETSDNTAQNEGLTGSSQIPLQIIASSIQASSAPNAAGWLFPNEVELPASILGNAEGPDGLSGREREELLRSPLHENSSNSLLASHSNERSSYGQSHFEQMYRCHKSAEALGSRGEELENKYSAANPSLQGKRNGMAQRDILQDNITATIATENETGVCAEKQYFLMLLIRGIHLVMFYQNKSTPRPRQSYQYEFLGGSGARSFLAFAAPSVSCS
mmetsp:Transcript_28084/g.82622  ORF Transcript_28084/g.82622 Transcript_28084/m.82622 type:complete len:554 (-) Transcript_28084:338-1999(-)